MLKDFHEKGPRNCVKSLCDVYLEKDNRRPTGMDCLARELNAPEIVVESTAFDERALIAHDRAVKYTGKAFS
jgi:hypothetical protein